MRGEDPKPRIVCSTGSLWMWEFERVLGTFADAGFGAAEVMVTRDPVTQQPGSLAAAARRTGVEIAAIHAPMLLLTRRVWGPSFMPIIERSVDLAERTGAGVVILHPPYLWELKYQAWMLGRLGDFRARCVPTVAVENMFRLTARMRGPRGHRWVDPGELRRFGSLVVDTSHCGADGYDILQALEVAGDQLVHVHLSDSDDGHHDSHALPGTGRLPLARFVKELGSGGYSGAVSLELDLRPLAQSPASVLDALKRSREFCEEHLGIPAR